MTNEKIIEINGTKLEVDMRYATRIDTLQIGTKVKVLDKSYGVRVVHGVVIGFEPFSTLPTIIIAYVKPSTYSNPCSVEFLYYNSDTKDYEVIAAHNDDDQALDKKQIVESMDYEMNQLKNKIEEIEKAKQYFLNKFTCYWGEIKLNDGE